MNSKKNRQVFESLKATGLLPDNLSFEAFLHQYQRLFDYYEKFKLENFPNETVVFGVQGPIGVGKTTFVRIMLYLLQEAGYKAAGVSIDDFYTNREDRLRLSKKHSQNPYYQISRGMPGTHDVKGLNDVSKVSKVGKPFALPQFDKSLHSGFGDVLPDKITVSKELDFFFIEGWFLGMRSHDHENFTATIADNQYVSKILEEVESDSKAHLDVLGYLEAYHPVWDSLDHVTYMTPSDVLYVKDWRIDQEQQLLKEKGEAMQPREVEQFIKHFIPFIYFISKQIAKDSENSIVLQVGKDRSFI